MEGMPWKKKQRTGKFLFFWLNIDSLLLKWGKKKKTKNPSVSMSFKFLQVPSTFFSDLSAIAAIFMLCLSILFSLSILGFLVSSFKIKFVNLREKKNTNVSSLCVGMFFFFFNKLCLFKSRCWELWKIGSDSKVWIMNFNISF